MFLGLFAIQDFMATTNIKYQKLVYEYSLIIPIKKATDNLNT